MTLVITIKDAANLEAPPQIGVLTMKVRNSVVELKDEAGTSLNSTSLSPPLTGTFGEKAGPSILSLVALDPFDRTLTYGINDTITITFSESTNEPAVFTKAELDELFTFSQNGQPASLGADYTGLFTDPLTLVIRIIDSDGATPPLVGKFGLKVNLAAGLTGVDVNGKANTLASVAESPALSGTFEISIKIYI